MNDRGQSNPDLKLDHMAAPPELPPDEGWLPVETYTAGANLRIVALECASRGLIATDTACATSATVLKRADAFLEWLEAEA